MRQTELKRSSLAVAVTLSAMVVLLSAVRAWIMVPPTAWAQEGADLFAEHGCTQCHHTDSRDVKVGPGLKGLFTRDRLPESGKAVNEANVRSQLISPHDKMPSFADRLSEVEIDRLIAYLKTL